MKTVTVDDICTLLNSFLEMDPECCNEIFHQRFECGEDLYNHPTIQVRKNSEGEYTTSVLSIINGLFQRGDNGFWPICYISDEYKQIVRFQPTPNQPVTAGDVP